MHNMKSLIVVYSYHHKNTLKIAEEISKNVNSDVKSILEITEEELINYSLIGFGSGIDSGKHYKELLEFVKKIPSVNKKKCYIFSTSAIQGEKKVDKDHTCLRKLLQSKGYEVIGEFSCKGFNTNSFLKYFGGMNKTRPNVDDLKDAKEFGLMINSIIK